MFRSLWLCRWQIDLRRCGLEPLNQIFVTCGDTTCTLGVPTIAHIGVSVSGRCLFIAQECKIFPRFTINGEVSENHNYLLKFNLRNFLQFEFLHPEQRIYSSVTR